MHRHLPLRARLALLTALAVTLAVAVASVTCWVLTRNQLRAQLDRTLQTTAAPLMGPRNATSFEEICSHAAPPEFQRGLLTYQVVQASGRYCTQRGGKSVPIDAEDVAVAVGTRQMVFHDAKDVDGNSVRVLTRHVGRDTAVSISRPLGEIEDSLDSLAVWLTVVCAIGILGAATMGLLVARAALKPVDRLTDAAEHVARTDDLDTVIPVAGRDEIARLGASFNAMTASLKASRLRQQRLIADAGHELRTPLTSLRTNADLLLRSERTGRPIPPADKERLLRNVNAQLVELSDLVGDLLLLARPENVPSEPPTTSAALDRAIRRAVERASLRAPNARIEVDVQPWQVRGEPAALERAVVNLLDNALKFGGAEGLVEVRLRDGELTVRDHGPGIAPADVPYVFERFWRAAAARGLPGSGLGLAIVARTVADAGGTITLEPASGGGTVARIRLPGTAA
ncbi:HAMP domain-containing sensor histidine kinase [Streptomyces sp. SID3343]|uniref:sensor histidine kinase n=1 Tax=Streptomyces sp. SID3343 TaxID=2690260 RepID=UPI00136AD35F|nr:HAMP domain-containing sensor histidine kinase [Streptomyces sp. SID3343]MYW05716.1 HAMP domain-containing protein [Streptomyces sp. SID3343]